MTDSNWLRKELIGLYWHGFYVESGSDGALPSQHTLDQRDCVIEGTLLKILKRFERKEAKP